MDRILGLDYGEKTVGVAISDPLGITAQSLETITRKDEISIKKTVHRIGEIIKEYNVNCIVLGFPKNMDNSEGERCNKTILFKERLERNFKRIPVILWDERLSTIASERGLFEAGLNSKERKQVVDKIAAGFILQGYLDNINRGE